MDKGVCLTRSIHGQESGSLFPLAVGLARVFDIIAHDENASPKPSCLLYLDRKRAFSSESKGDTGRRGGVVSDVTGDRQGVQRRRSLGTGKSWASVNIGGRFVGGGERGDR